MWTIVGQKEPSAMGLSYSTYTLECFHSVTDPKTTFHTNSFGNELDFRVRFSD